jgi:hypothetical protein
VHEFHPVYKTQMFIFYIFYGTHFHGNLETSSALMVLSALQEQVY